MTLPPLMLILEYFIRELQCPPEGATALATSPGFLGDILPYKFVVNAVAPLNVATSDALAQLLGIRVIEYECLPEWGLVWLKGTEMIGVIDLRRATKP